MPIKGLSEKRRLPRMGKIKLGIMVASKTSGTLHPKETDYFVCPEIVERTYGKEPKELVIIFPVEDEAVFFQQYYMRYGNGILLCKGDGEEAGYWDFDKGKYDTRKCPCEFLESKKCGAVGRLQFILPEVEEAAGVWQIDTRSKNSIIDINSGIDYLRSVCKRISWIPIKLIRAPIETSRIEGKEVKKSNHFTMKFSLEGITFAQLQKAAKVEPHSYFLPEPDESQPEDLFPPNGHLPEADKPKELQEKSEPVKEEDQKAPSEVKDIQITTADGAKRMVTRTKALEYFANLAETMPSEYYFQVLGAEGYTKSGEIPDETLGKVFAELLKQQQELTDDKKSDKK